MGKINDAIRKLLGVEPTEEQKKIIDELEAEANKKPNPAPNTNPNPAPGSNPELEAIKLQLADSQAQTAKLIEMIGKETQDREAGLKRLQDESDKKKKADIDKLIETATGDGRIEPKNEEKIKLFRTALEKDFETGKAIIDGLAKNPAFVKTELKTPDGGAGSQSNQMPASDPEAKRQSIIEKAREAMKAEATAN